MKLAPPGTGSNPPDHTYSPPDGKPLPVPWWFHSTSAQTFRALPLSSSDIVLSSGVKMGTTWVNKILVSLLYEYDDDGKLRDNVEEQRRVLPNRLGQTYPDAMYWNREEKEADVEGVFARVKNGREACDGIFGDFTFEDLLNQPEPRIFSTHLFGKRFLPQQLFDEIPKCQSDNLESKPYSKAKGRLIIVLRNLKDTMCSLHHFRGLPLDGWDGNDHGPGTYRRFIAEECPNSFGSAFDWVKETNDMLKYVAADRVHVVYYESFMLDFDAQLITLNDFLGLTKLTGAKREAIRKACAASTMANDNARYTAIIEKAKIGEWEKYLDRERWQEFDRIFDERLEVVGLAEPMRFFQCRNFKEKLGYEETLEDLKQKWKSVNNR
ncbi:hypothetical protein HJC23_008271 [Cyclotella cryptica]|uniref:Sulfotransferase domain-containing protein n=1 Tax=Cyclotella cryptica TaxID=29204 RepID=A0ABD3PDY5_9STRA|eukprot:CCRYP_015906-RA/>CCRYP_015906-RA protein AED:0.19 eAED:0.19 QI:159/1/0.5/1/1/1/2/0/379